MSWGLFVAERMLIGLSLLLIIKQLRPGTSGGDTQCWIWSWILIKFSRNFSPSFFGKSTILTLLHKSLIEQFNLLLVIPIMAKLLKSVMTKFLLMLFYFMFKPVDSGLICSSLPRPVGCLYPALISVYHLAWVSSERYKVTYQLIPLISQFPCHFFLALASLPASQLNIQISN